MNTERRNEDAISKGGMEIYKRCLDIQDRIKSKEISTAQAAEESNAMGKANSAINALTKSDDISAKLEIAAARTSAEAKD